MVLHGALGQCSGALDDDGLFGLALLDEGVRAAARLGVCPECRCHLTSELFLMASSGRPWPIL